MSKHPEHKDKGSGIVTPMAQNQMVANMVWDESEWLSNKKKTCWKCQKDSRPEKGCDMKITKGFHKYVCKECVNKRGKHDGHGST